MKDSGAGASGGAGLGGVTEADIAEFLVNTPGFFERHAELLATIQIASAHGKRVVSLQERQMEMLRERIRGLEMKIVEMIRAGQENMALADRLHRFMRGVMRTTDAALLPPLIVESLKHEFMIPHAAIRLWQLDASFACADFAPEVSEDLRTFAASLTLPYCGVDAGFEASEWLGPVGTVASLAMIPLRLGANATSGAQAAEAALGGTFGLLVLGSPDPTRYSADMGTEFLVRVGELASAALARLRARA